MDFLVIDGDKTGRDATCLLIDEEGHYAQPSATGEVALANLKEDKFDAVLLDLNSTTQKDLNLLDEIRKVHPNLPVVIFTAQGSVKLAVEAMRRGALDSLEKPCTREQFHAVLTRLHGGKRTDQSLGEPSRENRETKSRNPELLLDFAAPRMRAVMDVLERAANTPASILITGESGTGKSVLARAIHEQSHLADKPFVTVSCPSLSKELFESHLFGHVRGSFTGAIRDQWGKVQAATGGTLFLDEIGDLPLEIQPKLLRLLQEREYERLGENVTRQADVRIIAATNRDSKKQMAEGAFREDLYFRLNVITVEMPPLRERNGDLLRLSHHYLKHFSKKCGRCCLNFSHEGESRLMVYSWPGNLRELRNAIERAVVLARGDTIGAEDLPGEINGDRKNREAEFLPGAMVSLEQVQECHVRRVLDRSATVKEAALVLGIDPATIYRKRRKLDLAERLQWGTA